jgi:hypothetical protein
MLIVKTALLVSIRNFFYLHGYTIQTKSMLMSRCNFVYARTGIVGTYELFVPKKKSNACIKL